MPLWILGSFCSALPPCLSSLASLLNGPLWEEGDCGCPNGWQNMRGDGLTGVLEMAAGEEGKDRGN